MIYNDRSTFVRRDIQILSEKYDVEEFHFKSQPKSRTPFTFIKQFIFLLFKGWSYQKVVSQSAGYLSFFPALLSKIMPFKAYIIAIGTDGCRLPEINYGHYIKPFLSWFASASYRWSHKILPVHKSLHLSSYTYDDIAYPNQGFGNFIPNLKTPVKEVVNGYQHQLFTDDKPHELREKDFLTVAMKLNSAAYFRKGIDLILGAARLMPSHSFTIVSEFTPIEEIPKNVTIIQNVKQEELIRIYNNHKFYLQISMFEGFPNALCEAMLCGCIPVGSDVAAIPEIIGNTGYVLKKRKINELSSLLISADSQTPELLDNPRKRIQDNFPIERRAKELLAEIEK